MRKRSKNVPVQDQPLPQNNPRTVEDNLNLLAAVVGAVATVFGAIKTFSGK